MFPRQLHDEVELILERDCGTNLPFHQKSDENALERIRFAVLKLSHGEVDELLLQIAGAREDWRDTLMAAGFGYSVEEHNIWAENYLK